MLLNEVTEINLNEKKANSAFFGMLLFTLGASLLGYLMIGKNILTGKGLKGIHSVSEKL